MEIDPGPAPRRRNRIGCQMGWRVRPGVLKDRSWGQVLARFGQFADQGRTPALVQAPIYARPLKLVPVSSFTMRFRFIAMTVM